jgi:SOS-response transcriptional repressor LexA
MDGTYGTAQKIHENSRKSYRENEESGKGKTYRQQIVRLLKETGESLTDREIQERLGVKEKSNIQPEVTRLRQKGIIKEAGKTKCPVTNKTVRVVYINTEFTETLF